MLSKDDWKEIEKTLRNLWCPVNLWIDGYKVTLILSRISTYTLAIKVYVNGSWKGKWMLEDCEERRRFYWESKRYRYNQAIRKKFKKKTHLLGMSLKDLNSTFSIWFPYFQSFSQLKSHFLKHNESIEFYDEALHGKIEEPAHAAAGNE